VELVETVHRRQEFIAVAEMVLANLRSSIALRFEQFGDGRVLVLDTLFSARQADFEQARAERRLTEDERGATRRAGLLGVVVGEQYAFLRDPVNIGRAPAHHPAMVGADIPDANVIA